MRVTTAVVPLVLQRVQSASAGSQLYARSVCLVGRAASSRDLVPTHVDADDVGAEAFRNRRRDPYDPGPPSSQASSWIP